MPSIPKRWSQWLSWMAVLFSGTCLVHGHTYHQSGVESNFLVDDERAAFAQSDGSLTVLDLKSGTVLVRNRSGYFSGSLIKTKAGILGLRYSSISLLDAKTFTVIWQSEAQYDADLSGDRIVSQDGWGIVQCRRLRDGTVLWSYKLSGALDVVVGKNGQVLIHRAATYDTNTPTTVLVDLESGKEIFRKVPPAKIHWDNCYFDGTNIYIKAGAFEGQRSDFEITEMLVWNTRGEEVQRLPIEAALAKEIRGDSAFEIDGKTFWRGKVYASRDSIGNERIGVTLHDDERREENPDFWHEGYRLDETTTFRSRNRMNYGENEENSTLSACEIEVETEKGSWSGTLTYMPPYGRVASAARAGDKILIGSNFGHVECIEVGTGKSLWLYVFPTHRRTMSYSSYGMPPMMADAARAFRRENANPPTKGLELREGKSSDPKVILDPQPMDPFKRLPFYLVAAWSGAGITLVCMLFVLRNRRQAKPIDISSTCLLLCVISFGVLMMFGRVSIGSAIALRVAVASALVCGSVYAIKSVRSARTLGAALLIGCFIGLALICLPLMLRL